MKKQDNNKKPTTLSGWAKYWSDIADAEMREMLPNATFVEKTRHSYL